jgi:plasmid stabilization system protein ParE
MNRMIIWSPLAERDLDIILQYLKEKWDTNTMNQFIDLTEKILDQISTNPKQFQIIFKKKKVRKCVLTKHNTLYYRFTNDQIQILGIFDNRQDPKTLILK